jgi:hypothetical protein
MPIELLVVPVQFLLILAFFEAFLETTRSIRQLKTRDMTMRYTIENAKTATRDIRSLE